MRCKLAKQRKTKIDSKTREALKIVSEGVKDMITVNHMEEEILCPTIFTSLNRATGVGGIPKRKMIAIHGKNSTGKSVGANGLLESLRRVGDVPVKFDCEYADEKRWMNSLLLGEDTLFHRPLNMDELYLVIQKNLDNLEGGKKVRKIKKEVGLAIAIDTLTKLVPEEQWNAIIEKGIEQSYPLAAKWVSMWSKMIVPQAYRSNSTFVIVLQERQNIGATKFQKQRKVTLGEALLYDVSIRIDFTHSTPVKKGEMIVGSQHHFKLEKNKVDGFTAQAGSIFTSTGKGDVPSGFDFVREAIEEGKQRGVIKQNSAKTTIASNFGEEDKPLATGGWEDLREKLQHGESRELDWLVGRLNEQARRSG